MRPTVAPPEQRPVALALRGMVVAGRGLRRCCSSPSPRRSRSRGWRTRETRTTSYRVLGDLAGIRLDLGDADVEIDGGGHGGRGAARRPVRVRQAVGGAPHHGRRPLHHRLALPGPGARRLPHGLPADRARQRPDRDRDRRAARCGSRACARRSRSAPARGRSPRPAFCGFSLRASSDSGDVTRGRRVLGRPARAALAQRRRARGGARPAATRSTPRATRARPASAASTPVDDAPFQIQALSTSGDVTVEAAS